MPGSGFRAFCRLWGLGFRVSGSQGLSGLKMDYRLRVIEQDW